MAIINGIYCQSQFFDGDSDVQTDLSGSGFNTVIGDALDLGPTGDITYAGTLNSIVSNGQLVLSPYVPNWWPWLKGQGSSITTILLGMGGNGLDTFSTVSAFVPQPLLENLTALKQAFPFIDGFDLTDDFMSCADGVVAFAQLAAQAGFTQITFNPELTNDVQTDIAYWQGCYSAIQASNPGLVSAVNLQWLLADTLSNCEAWADAFPDVPVTLGIQYLLDPPSAPGRCPDSYTFILQQVSGGKLGGATMCTYDEFVASPPPVEHCKAEGTLPEYSAAIAAAF